MIDNTKNTLYNLQIIRGIAAITVLLAHANSFLGTDFLGGIFIPGWSGVDFFFVLSGFIIYFTNYKDIGNARKLPSYITKRFIRVFPIYWLYILLTLCLAGFIYLAGYGILNKKLTLITWMDINIYTILQNLVLYPGGAIIPTAWTLSYEIFFYSIFALTIVYRPKVSFSILLLWIALIICNSIGAIHGDNVLLNLATNTKNYEFMMGALIAIVYVYAKNKEEPWDSIARLLIIGGVLFCAYLWREECINISILGDVDRSKSKSSVVFGIAYSLIILGAVLLEEVQVYKEKSRLWKMFVFFGEASYSIYLTHFIVFSFLLGTLRMIGIGNSYTLFFMEIVVGLCIGCLAYQYIEKPLLKMLRKRFLKERV